MSDRSLLRLAAMLYNVPLLVLPERAETIERVFAAYVERRTAELPKLEAEPPREDAAMLVPMRRTEAGYSITDRGVAVLNVHGTLVQRAGSLDALSGLTGYNRLGAQLDAALRDPLVRGVVLSVDSPGGEVAGAFQFAEMVATAPKPIWGVADELAASAAYLIASATARLFMPETAQVGSVGVVMLHQDRSAQVERSGVRYTPIYAGAKKIDGSSLGPLSETARADLQARVDEVYQMFVNAVADYRGIDAEAIRATEAGMLSTSAAIASKFADEQGTLTTAILAMQEKVAGFGFSYKSRAPRAIHGGLMSNETKESAAPATVEALANERAAGYAAAEKELVPKAIADGAKAERERIRAILEHAESADRPKAAMHVAMATAMTVDEAAAFLAGLPKEAPAKAENALDVAMRAAPNPKIGADAERERAAPGATLSSQKIYANRAKALGTLAVVK